MSFHGLEPAVVRDLVARFGSLSAAAEAARKVPGFAEQFAYLDSAMRYGVADDGASERAWALVAAALPPDEGGDEVDAEVDDLVGGRPYFRSDYDEARKLFVKGKMTNKGIMTRTQLSDRRAYRIYRQFKNGAVVPDAERVRPGPGYCWDPDKLDNDPPLYRLIRG